MDQNLVVGISDNLSASAPCETRSREWGHQRLHSFNTDFREMLFHAILNFGGPTARHVSDHEHLAPLDRGIEAPEAGVADVHTRHAAKPRPDCGAGQRRSERHATCYWRTDHAKRQPEERCKKTGRSAHHQTPLRRRYEIRLLGDARFRQILQWHSAAGEDMDVSQLYTREQQLVNQTPCGIATSRARNKILFIPVSSSRTPKSTIAGCDPGTAS
jgi:hypothetical protein